MEELTWKRKEYQTWDEAFMGLAPAQRQHSVRVASYTRVLFVQACNASFGNWTADAAKRIDGKYADLAYKCGMYHQLGKALVPEEYQVWRNDFTDEEKALYKKYTTDGRILVANLQERSQRSKFRRRGEFKEAHTDNLTWLMLREACEEHMERYDGKGYPNGLIGDAISPIAQIVGLAKALDILVCETKSEDPFSEAIESLNNESGHAFSPELINILKASRSKCRTVYNKYIHYTMAIPKTFSLVEKRKDRPMGLKYRPIINGEEGKVNAYRADMWFGGIADRPGETENSNAVEEMLCRTDLVSDMSFYFLYEAADTLLRIENCKLNLDYLVLDMLPSFYKEGSQLQKFNLLFRNQPIKKDSLLLTIPQMFLLNANKGTLEVISRYLKNGINLLLSDWDPEYFTKEKLIEFGFKFVSPDKKLYLKPDSADVISSLVRDKITVIAEGCDSQDILVWLSACGVRYLEGTLTGETVNEDELIRDSLLREREVI